MINAFRNFGSFHDIIRLRRLWDFPPLSEQFQCISRLQHCCQCWGDCQPAGRECWDPEDPCSELPSTTPVMSSRPPPPPQPTEFETFDSRAEVLGVCEVLCLVLVHQAVDQALVNLVIILQYYLDWQIRPVTRQISVSLSSNFTSATPSQPASHQPWQDRLSYDSLMTSSPTFKSFLLLSKTKN